MKQTKRRKINGRNRINLLVRSDLPDYSWSGPTLINVITPFGRSEEDKKEQVLFTNYKVFIDWLITLYLVHPTEDSKTKFYRLSSVHRWRKKWGLRIFPIEWDLLFYMGVTWFLALFFSDFVSCTYLNLTSSFGVRCTCVLSRLFFPLYWDGPYGMVLPRQWVSCCHMTLVIVRIINSRASFSVVHIP